MFASALRYGCHLFVPGGLLLAAAAAALPLLELPPQAQAFLPYYPPLVLALGLFFGWRFNRSRLLFALLALAMADRALHLFPPGGAAPLVPAAVALLLPLNLALLSTLAERGLLTPLGVARLALLFAQPAAVAWAARACPAEVAAWLQGPLLAHPLLERLPLPQPALLALLLSLLLLAARFLRSPGALEGGFLWAVVATVPALAPGVPPALRTLYFATAGFILVAAVVEASYRMAFRDELTGLPARRALNETLQKVGRRYTVAMVDVDHFKKVNDRFGHDVGDQVLKMVAARLARVSGGGRPFRYGGEEFTVLFPGTDAAGALPHLERLREEIAASGFTLRGAGRPQRKPKGKGGGRPGGERLAVTVSIGVAERSGERPLPEQVIKAADQALYRAKKGGRNRVCG